MECISSDYEDCYSSGYESDASIKSEEMKEKTPRTRTQTLTTTEEHEFRNYEDSEFQDRVARTYNMMHTNQTLDFVKSKHEHWVKLNHGEYTIMEVAKMLDSYVDESDPDSDHPNSVHAFQTAEMIRKQHPEPEFDWFVFMGFVHDLGKVIGLWGEPQWCVVGDTFPVGCAYADECVFGRESFRNNPDFNHPIYSTRLGIYSENCGLDNVYFSWGHDEYMYQVLMRNPQCARLNPMAKKVIRYHSFYPLHGKDAYRYLMNDEDHETLKWVRVFQKYDLYSKDPEVPDLEAIRSYYDALIEKYAPGKLRW